MIKISPFVFIASVAANAAMLIFLVAGSVGRPEVSDAASADAVAARGSTDVSTSAAHRAARSGATGAGAEEAQAYAGAWPKLQTVDLKVLAARLRDEGFPQPVIREIMREQIFRQVDARWMALDPDENTRPFWKVPLNEAEIAAGRAEINRERVQMLREVFSAEADPNYRAMNERRRRDLDFLAPDKAEQVMAVLRKFDEQSMPLNMLASRGPAENDKLNEISADLHKELATMLTPAELEDYDLRTSRVASALRFQLSGFDASEQEFRTLYRIQSAYADRLALSGAPTPGQLQARSATQQQLNNDIKAALGDQRYEEYRRSGDYNYREAYKLVARLALPPTTTNQVWDIQQDIQKRAASIDRNLTPEARGQQLAALAGEAQSRVTSLLGEAGFAAYQEHGGQWLRPLQMAGRVPAQQLGDPAAPVAARRSQ